MYRPCREFQIHIVAVLAFTMATEGTKTDPHLMCISGDGAGLTAASTGVRVGHFVGSTNLLNQSSLDVVTWLFYKAQTKAEDYTVLNARLIAVLPDLQRLYNGGEPGELLLDGVATGIFVQLVLVADKPFIRHVCGLLSHNADAFGAHRDTDRESTNVGQCDTRHD